MILQRRSRDLSSFSSRSSCGGALSLRLVTSTHVSQSELPDGPLQRLGLREHLHADLSVHHRLVCERPVVVALHLESQNTSALSRPVCLQPIRSEPHPPPLVTLRQHHHDGRLLLKHHLPEVVPSLRQRPLGGDVLLRMFVSLKHDVTVTTTTPRLSSSLRYYYRVITVRS